MTMSLCRYRHTSVHLFEVTERPGVTPGVLATLGLNVQVDGGRKMLQKTAANYPSSPPPFRPNKASQAQLNCAYLSSHGAMNCI